jgi:hypothetical protein
MSSAEIRITLAGQPLPVLPGWLDVEVLATFDSGEVQGNITTDSFRFILEGYTRLKQAIEDGKTGGAGIFQPVPIKLETFSALGTYAAFTGGVRLVDAKIDDERGEIEAPIERDTDVRGLDDMLSGLSFLYLYEIGVITAADFVDVDYVVDAPDKVLQAIIAQLTLFMLLRELADQVRTISNQIATAAADAADIPPNPTGAAVYAALAIIINIAYAAVILVLIINIGTDIVTAFLMPVRTHQGILLRTLLAKAAQHLGFGFNTSISQLSNLVYLPSNIKLDKEDGIRGFLGTPGTIERGIPGANDFGYIAAEAFQLARQLFNARYQVINGVVEIHREDSLYWIRQASYILPNILPSPYRYNTDRLKDSVFIRFATDLADVWTLDEYRGTAFQVITSAITPGPDNIEGLDEVAIPVALGNRKDKLTGIEKVLRLVAVAVDTATGIFGGGTNLAGQVSGKVGVLKVATNNHSIPKLLYMDGGRIPENHRDLFSARVLWEQYHITKSLVWDGFKQQRRVYEEVSIPFGFADFLALIDNSYCLTADGKSAKVTRLVWNMAKDRALVDYEVGEVYTKNLKETTIEPTSDGAIVQ